VIVVSGVFDLSAFLAMEWELVEAARQRLDERLLAGIGPRVADPIRYALDAGGKRLRPILCVAAYRAVIGSPLRGAGESVGEMRITDHRSGGEGSWGREAMNADAIYEIAIALELIHTYSLVHDDLPCMDDDDLRRGQPTTHRAFGVSAAITAGAALIPLACLALELGGRSLGLEADERATLTLKLCQAAGAAGMVGGQWLDLEAEGRRVGLAELEGIHHRKTGALLAAAAQIGGLAARADTEVVTALGTYGQALGLAFQIADDILDLTGDPALLGKAAGRDLSLGKATYPAHLGVEGARDRAEAEADRAITALRGVGLATTELEALARYAVERNH
jgi:geranylgeranyl pyrophosphate synthase